MKKMSLAVTVFAAQLSMVQAADIENGKAVHQSKCMACHDNSIYTRPNSIIHSYSSLQNRVKFCDVAAQANLSETQINDIVAYLNQAFYKFPQSQ